MGTGWARWVVGAHAAAGLALLLLGPWKSVIARRALARRPPRRGRAVGLGLAVLVAVALATGIGHSTGLLRSLGPVTAMQVHVGAALATLPLALWHLLARPQRPHRTDFGRRGLLRAGALAGAAGLAWAAVEGLERLTGSPGGRRRFTGSYATGSLDPSKMPDLGTYRRCRSAAESADLRVASPCDGAVAPGEHDQAGGAVTMLAQVVGEVRQPAGEPPQLRHLPPVAAGRG